MATLERETEARIRTRIRVMMDVALDGVDRDIEETGTDPVAALALEAIALAAVAQTLCRKAGRLAGAKA